MLNIGITGANGFLGLHLVNILGLNKSSFNLIEFQREWFNSQIELDQFVNKCDIIIHLAGLNRHNDESYLYETNVSLANILVSSFIRTEFKGLLLFASSIQEFKNNNFGNSKKKSNEIFADWSIRFGTTYKSLLIPNVFGAFGKPFYNSFISTFCYQLINNEIPEINVDSKLELVYVDDLIYEIIELFKSKSTGSIIFKNTQSYTVSDVLKKLIDFKRTYLELGHIPKLNSKFDLDLFNTFRSYIDHNAYFPVKYKNNLDNRGNFVELIRLNAGGQISFSTTKKGITRGNHFHTRKIERFSVIKGSALIQLRKIGTREIHNLYLTGDEPAYVDMPIWHTHNIKNIGEEELITIFWINEFYDENNPDTYFEIV